MRSSDSGVGGQSCRRRSRVALDLHLEALSRAATPVPPAPNPERRPSRFGRRFGDTDRDTPPSSARFAGTLGPSLRNRPPIGGLTR
jgi:hypothetical protein